MCKLQPFEHFQYPIGVPVDVDKAYALPYVRGGASLRHDILLERAVIFPRYANALNRET